MSRRCPSRSRWIVLILLAFFTVLSSIALVAGVPAEPPPPTDVSEAAPMVSPPPVRSSAGPPPPPAAAPPRTEGPVRPDPAPEAKRGALDRMARARLRANETAAVATARNISCAQAQMQASAHVDENRDGTGEFGSLAEMAGACPVRGSDRAITPSVLSKAFGEVDTLGRVTRNGYVFALHLPGPGGRSVTEQPGGGLLAGLTDPRLAATTWCMYAWPEKYGVTGRRTFVVNQSGDVASTDCPDYTGENGPAADAAFRPDPATTSTILGNLAVGAKGNDGRVWKAAN